MYQISPQKVFTHVGLRLKENKMENECSIKWDKTHYGGKEEILEVYIFNYTGNLYQKRIKVAFVEKLEMKKNLIVIRI